MTLLVAAMAVAACAAAAPPPRPVVTDLVPIDLHQGITVVPAFAQDGRAATIALASRENGNAWGYDVALVMLPGVTLPGGPGDDTWDLVRIDPTAPDEPESQTVTIADEPHTFEDAVRVFRFARGRVDGRPATLLLVASRDPGESVSAPSLVTFEVYRLEHSDDDVGTTPDHFAQILRERSTSNFCNADVALSRRFRLPPAQAFRGAATPDGCPR